MPVPNFSRAELIATIAHHKAELTLWTEVADQLTLEGQLEHVASIDALRARARAEIVQAELRLTAIAEPSKHLLLLNG